MKKIIIVLAMVLAGVAMYAQEPQVLACPERRDSHQGRSGKAS